MAMIMTMDLIPSIVLVLVVLVLPLCVRWGLVE